MKQRYWIYILVLVIVSGFFGKMAYDGYEQKQSEFLAAREEQRKMTAIAKEIADARLHAKKRPPIELPYCVNYNVTDLNALYESGLKAVVGSCVLTLLKNKDYKNLDLMISEFREKKLRTPSGLWLQSVFYQSAQKYLDTAVEEKDFDRIDTELASWIREPRDSDAARLILVDSMNKRAWLYRGYGYSNAVPPANLAKFNAQVAKTRKYLLDNEEISTRDPKWFSEMLDVINIGENASALEHKQYFDKAVSLYPEYYPIYYEASIFYYKQWHGAAMDGFDNFLTYAVKHLPPNEAKVVYARIYLSSVCIGCEDTTSGRWVDHWDKIAAGFDQMLVDYPEPWNLNLYGWMACSAGDKKRTLTVLRKLKRNVDFEVWQEPFTHTYCVKMADLMEENRRQKSQKMTDARLN
jgi:hypothetical protein